MEASDIHLEVKRIGVESLDRIMKEAELLPLTPKQKFLVIGRIVLFVFEQHFGMIITASRAELQKQSGGEKP